MSSLWLRRARAFAPLVAGVEQLTGVELCEGRHRPIAQPKRRHAGRSDRVAHLFGSPRIMSRGSHLCEGLAADGFEVLRLRIVLRSGGGWRGSWGGSADASFLSGRGTEVEVELERWGGSWGLVAEARGKSQGHSTSAFAVTFVTGGGDQRAEGRGQGAECRWRELRAESREQRSNMDCRSAGFGPKAPGRGRKAELNGPRCDWLVSLCGPREHGSDRQTLNRRCNPI